MNKPTSLRTGSLLERAADAFDFQAEFLRSEGAAARIVVPPIPAIEEPFVPPVQQVDEQPAAEPQAAHEAPIAAAPAEEPLVAVPDRDPPATAIRPVEPVGEELNQARGEQAHRRSVRIDRERLRESGFVEPDGPVTTLAEEFRIIKRQLLLAAQGRGPGSAKGRTILVCSAQPDDGKTFCAINLALSMALEKDLEVLLIDGDFSNPTIPGLLGIPPATGFTDAVMAPGTDPDSFVIQTDIGGLSFLPAGRPTNNITELLASARTREVLAALTEAHPKRLIIFDSPPVLAASPASVLASHAGQVMMVVRADQTTEADLREAVSLLSACEQINLVLNRASLAVTGRRFGTYYGDGE